MFSTAYQCRIEHCRTAFPGRCVGAAWKGRPTIVTLNWLVLLFGILAEQTLAEQPHDPPVTAQDRIKFARDIYPILRENCLRCHQGSDPSPSVRLDLKDKLLGLSDGVPLVHPGNSAESRIIQRVQRRDEQRMPPPDEGTPLTDGHVALLRAWIDQGLDWNDEPFEADAAKTRQHWAFQPIRRPPVPEVVDETWGSNAVDRFIRGKHESAGIEPSVSASPEVLIRRVSLNLSGLPPTPSEVAEFLADRSPDAYERLVERHLASPHYGERWGRHWLIRAVKLTRAVARTPEQEAVYRQARARLNIRLAGCNGFRIAEAERQRLNEVKSKIDAHQTRVRQTWAFYSPVTSPHRLIVLPMASNFPLIHDTHALGKRSAYLLRRGDPYTTVFPIMPDWPAVLGDLGNEVDLGGPGLRTNLAKWLTSSKNPLSARVWVNRIWHYHFRRGLVSTPGNFGVRGAAPTHPELLDYLASELIESGWSTKHIQRLIVCSNTYRQCAAAQSDAAAIDPDNRLYWRWPAHRLESEIVRDSALAVSGQLDTSLGGPSVPVGQDSRRRSLYLFQRRDQPTDLQSLFDGPTAMSASCDQRHVSTTALQALFLLNDAHAGSIAESFAQRLRKVGGADAERHAVGRSPSDFELRTSCEYTCDRRTQHRLNFQNRWTVRPRDCLHWHAFAKR